MAKHPDDDGDGHHRPEPRDLSDDEVAEAFSALSHQYVQESLTGPRDYSPMEEDDQFVAPDPGPVSSPDPFLNLGWILLAGGLFLILGSLMLWPGAPRSFHILLAAGVLVGAAILTWRMPKHKDHDDDDAGAVV